MSIAALEEVRSMPEATPAPDAWQADRRLGGLTRFAIAITVLNIAGHLYLGFEQSWATPFIGIATAYTVELLGETIEAWASRRRLRYSGSFASLVRFLLPAHITGLAVGMLLYAPQSHGIVVFGAAAAIASKYVFRVAVPQARPGPPSYRHYLNPSNFGIAVVLLLFANVGVAAPYQFSENTSGPWDVLIPLIVICTGSLLNTVFTQRVPLILAWACGFIVQALVRAAMHETPLFAGLMPMTGFAFLLFSFYMITDPATTPSGPRAQVAFGAGVALTYGILMELHVVFTLFFALAVVTVLRGAGLAIRARVHGDAKPVGAAAAQISPAS